MGGVRKHNSRPVRPSSNHHRDKYAEKAAERRRRAALEALARRFNGEEEGR